MGRSKQHKAKKPKIQQDGERQAGGGDKAKEQNRPLYLMTLPDGMVNHRSIREPDGSFPCPDCWFKDLPVRLGGIGRMVVVDNHWECINMRNHLGTGRHEIACKYPRRYFRRCGPNVKFHVSESWEEGEPPKQYWAHWMAAWAIKHKIKKHEDAWTYYSEVEAPQGYPDYWYPARPGQPPLPAVNGSSQAPGSTLATSGTPPPRSSPLLPPDLSALLSDSDLSVEAGAGADKQTPSPSPRHSRLAPNPPRNPTISGFQLAEGGGYFESVADAGAGDSAIVTPPPARQLGPDATDSGSAADGQGNGYEGHGSPQEPVSTLATSGTPQPPSALLLTPLSGRLDEVSDSDVSVEAGARANKQTPSLGHNRLAPNPPRNPTISGFQLAEGGGYFESVADAGDGDSSLVTPPPARQLSPDANDSGSASAADGQGDEHEGQGQSEDGGGRGQSADGRGPEGHGQSEDGGEPEGHGQSEDGKEQGQCEDRGGPEQPQSENGVRRGQCEDGGEPGLIENGVGQGQSEYGEKQERDSEQIEHDTLQATQAAVQLFAQQEGAAVDVAHALQATTHEQLHMEGAGAAGHANKHSANDGGGHIAQMAQSLYDRLVVDEEPFELSGLLAGVPKTNGQLRPLMTCDGGRDRSGLATATALQTRANRRLIRNINAADTKLVSSSSSTSTKGRSSRSSGRVSASQSQSGASTTTDHTPVAVAASESRSVDAVANQQSTSKRAPARAKKTPTQKNPTQNTPVQKTPTQMAPAQKTPKQPKSNKKTKEKAVGDGTEGGGSVQPSRSSTRLAIQQSRTEEMVVSGSGCSTRETNTAAGHELAVTPKVKPKKQKSVGVSGGVSVPASAVPVAVAPKQSGQQQTQTIAMQVQRTEGKGAAAALVHSQTLSAAREAVPSWEPLAREAVPSQPAAREALPSQPAARVAVASSEPVTVTPSLTTPATTLPVPAAASTALAQTNTIDQQMQDIYALMHQPAEHMNMRKDQKPDDRAIVQLAAQGAPWPFRAPTAGVSRRAAPPAVSANTECAPAAVPRTTVARSMPAAAAAHSIAVPCSVSQSQMLASHTQSQATGTPSGANGAQALDLGGVSAWTGQEGAAVMAHSTPVRGAQPLPYTQTQAQGSGVFGWPGLQHDAVASQQPAQSYNTGPDYYSTQYNWQMGAQPVQQAMGWSGGHGQPVTGAVGAGQQAPPTHMPYDAGYPGTGYADYAQDYCAVAKQVCSAFLGASLQAPPATAHAQPTLPPVSAIYNNNWSGASAVTAPLPQYQGLYSTGSVAVQETQGAFMTPPAQPRPFYANRYSQVPPVMETPPPSTPQPQPRVGNPIIPALGEESYDLFDL